MRNLLSDIERPTFDFSAVESRTGLAISNEAQFEIQEAYDGYSLSVFKQIIAEATKKGASFGPQPEGQTDKSEFDILSAKLEKTAAELRVLVDRLADFDTGLLARPYDNRDRSYPSPNRRNIVEENLRCSFPSYMVDEQDFADIYAFRKLLDYFENFRRCNERFNNDYASRYSFETDYSDFEFLVRQIVIRLRDSGYPSTITIPTDTNPDYESPLIAALLEFQQQHNSAFGNVESSTLVLARHYNYRQFAHLVSQIIGQIDRLYAAFDDLRRSIYE